MRGVTQMSGLVVALGLAVCTACLAVSEDLEITGDVRLRLRYVDSGSRGPVRGTYGELVNRGFSHRHRFLLEAAYPIATSIRIGGMLRVSNEDENVLRTGPDYLSSDFGSAFIAYETPAVTSRFGYYSTAYTPLTLMRWDLKDDPEGGGGGTCAVCGGAGGAGAILGETLEELGPDLTFEGLKVELAPLETFAVSAFFAQPEVAGETYPVITFGGRAGLKRYIRQTSSFLDLALILVRSENDRNFLRDEDLDREMSAVFGNTVYGAAWNLPLAKGLTFDGEWTITKSDSQDVDDPFGRVYGREGRGGVVSLNAKVHRHVNLDASYLYLSPNWRSFFRALSYNPNQQGVRLRLEYASHNVLIALFGKYLKAVEHPEAFEAEDLPVYPTLSARGYAKITPDLNLGLAAVYSGQGTEGDGATIDIDEESITWLWSLTFEFGKDASVTLEERYVQRRSETEGDSDVSLLSLYARAAIW